MGRLSRGAPPPRHVAIIMDGNGRWAQARGLPRLRGHEEGTRAAERTVRAAAEIGIEYLTLFAFSTENWKRPRREVSFLMDLLKRFLAGQRADELAEKGIRFLHIGSRAGLPKAVAAELARVEERTRGGRRMTLALAFNYGGRAELVEAAGRLVERARRGETARVDEESFAAELWTARLPDVDLLIRTGGEKRLSNFLLWRVSYAELYFARVLWPDFTRRHLLSAVRSCGRRRRRFGGI